MTSYGECSTRTEMLLMASLVTLRLLPNGVTSKTAGELVSAKWYN